MKQISTPRIRLSPGLCAALLLMASLGISETSMASVKGDPAYGYTNSNSNGLMGSLPVVLTPLKGYYSKGVSHLYWSSLQESNSSYFEIQRSNDGMNFYAVGKVMAASASDKEVDYTYDDIRAGAGANYYRLKLLDKDGKYQFSNIEMLSVSIKGIYITGIYPAPFTDKVNVTISSEVKTEASIHIFDNTGKQVISRQAVLTNGVTNLVVGDLDGLSRGFYVIRVQAGDTFITKKLIK